MTTVLDNLAGRAGRRDRSMRYTATTLQSPASTAIGPMACEHLAAGLNPQGSAIIRPEPSVHLRATNTSMHNENITLWQHGHTFGKS